MISLSCRSHLPAASSSRKPTAALGWDGLAAHTSHTHCCRSGGIYDYELQDLAPAFAILPGKRYELGRSAPFRRSPWVCSPQFFKTERCLALIEEAEAQARCYRRRFPQNSVCGHPCQRHPGDVGRRSTDVGRQPGDLLETPIPVLLAPPPPQGGAASLPGLSPTASSPPPPCCRRAFAMILSFDRGRTCTLTSRCPTCSN